MNLRHRLARLLVGRYILLPEEDGVWIVIREKSTVMTAKATTFRLRSRSRLDPKLNRAADAGKPISDFSRFATSKIHFVGTVR